MRLVNTITRFKNLMLSSLEEYDSESKISSVIKLQCLKVSFTIKSLKKLRKSKELRTSMRRSRTKSNAEFAGVQKKIRKIHWLLHANAEELLVSFISNAWKIGFSLKNKKSLQIPKIRTSDHFTGSVLNVKFASRCTHIPSRYKGRFTKLLISQSSWLSLTTTFC